jgi:hypothetical protein
MALPTLFCCNNKREAILKDARDMAKHLLQCHPGTKEIEGTSTTKETEGASTLLNALINLDLVPHKMTASEQQFLILGITTSTTTALLF